MKRLSFILGSLFCTEITDIPFQIKCPHLPRWFLADCQQTLHRNSFKKIYMYFTEALSGYCWKS